MHQSRPGPLYSPLGCGAAIVLVLVLGIVLFLSGGVPFSPGKLSASGSGEEITGFSSHADFEGDCHLCHAPWKGIETERCEACHQNINDERLTNTGLHGRLQDVGRCQNCHTDHKGRDGKQILLDLSSFEHEKLTSFSLAKHKNNYDDTELVCSNCHTESRFNRASLNCEDCHGDHDPIFMSDHSEFFGSDCLDCHNGVDTMANFDHEQIFSLEGAHGDLDCDVCHIDQVFRGTPTDCVDCHEEPNLHAGLFGTDCVRCHSSTSWTPAQLTNHTFPLDHGDDGKLECQTCHVGSYSVYTCFACHEHEENEIREEHIEEGIFEFENCAECHPTGLED